MEVVVQAGVADDAVVAPTAHRAGIRDDRAAACHRLLEEIRHAACPEIVVERFGLERPVREDIHSTPPPTKPARNRESVKELKPAVVPPKWGDARNGGAAEVDTTDGHTARAVDRKIVRRQEASASARCAEIAQVTGDSLLVEHREAGKRRTDAPPRRLNYGWRRRSRIRRHCCCNCAGRTCRRYRFRYRGRFCSAA